jgi:ADP-dependent NAD(P)H-hydrate dehydratase / NAD(P)H-hydrate epimerase
MKIVSSHQMAELEASAYRAGASESDFMEEAGSGIALLVQDYLEINNLNHQVLLLCGKGNNAGDAYVAGIYLLNLEYIVFALQIEPIEICTPLCKQNYERFIHEGGRLVSSFSECTSAAIILDGIFGTGFRGNIDSKYAAIIELANQSRLPIIAVDIPSGLNGETGKVEKSAIIATATAFLGLPKTGFFLLDGWNHVGKLHYVDFGLSQEFIAACPSDLIMLSADILMPLLPPIKRSRHKYEAGYVIGLAGSSGMPGAAILASTAALRGGAGIVRLFHPEGMQAELASSPSELIREAYSYNQDFDHIIESMNRASATFIGPGIGKTSEVRQMLRKILPRLQKPCVIDADALTILAEEENYILPEHSIMTPHMGEMMRLLKMPSHHSLITLDFLKICKKFAEDKKIILILKGAPTFILSSSNIIYVNPSGDPGMATAGSGDVLTGFVASLLAQQISPLNAAMLAVFLHGIAGEVAAEDLTSYCLNASDLIFHFPEAFKFLRLV